VPLNPQAPFPEQPFPVQLEPDGRRVFVETFPFFRARQGGEFFPARMRRRQKGLFPMQNGRIVVVGVISPPGTAGHQVKRDGVAQRRMRHGQEIRIAQERNL
jgi:hypothetical protein